jgi:hypothetical protein
MARSFDGSTQYGTANSVPVTGPPFTLACWFYCTGSAGNFYELLEVCNFASPSKHRLYVDGSGTAGNNATLAAYSANAGFTTTDEAKAGAQVTFNQWQHGCGVWASSGSRACYISGGNKGTNTTVITTGTLDTGLLGVGSSGGGHSQFFPGRIAEACVWSAALTDQEVAALAAGVNPRRIRPGSVAAYWPLWGFGSPETDLSGSANNLTLTAGPPAANHAPLQLFSRRGPGTAAALDLPAHLARRRLPRVAPKEPLSAYTW